MQFPGPQDLKGLGFKLSKPAALAGFVDLMLPASNQTAFGLCQFKSQLTAAVILKCPPIHEGIATPRREETPAVGTQAEGTLAEGTWASSS